MCIDFPYFRMNSPAFKKLVSLAEKSKRKIKRAPTRSVMVRGSAKDTVPLFDALMSDDKGDLRKHTHSSLERNSPLA